MFNEILTNVGGHYNNATSSFICPWHGIYLVSVDVMGYDSDYIYLYLMRNDVNILIMLIDGIPDARNHGSKTLVTECDRGDALWVRAGHTGALYTHPVPTTLFTAHMIHRY